MWQLEVWMGFYNVNFHYNFFNLFWSCKNVLALHGYNFFHRTFKKYNLFYLIFFLDPLGSYIKTKKISKKIINFLFLWIGSISTREVLIHSMLTSEFQYLYKLIILLSYFKGGRNNFGQFY
jgi:hypothetical protein